MYQSHAPDLQRSRFQRDFQPFSNRADIEGQELGDIRSRGRLPPKRAAWRRCRGLSTARDEGVVHCELKPQNVASRSRHVGRPGVCVRLGSPAGSIPAAGCFCREDFSCSNQIASRVRKMSGNAVCELTAATRRTRAGTRRLAVKTQAWWGALQACASSEFWAPRSSSSQPRASCVEHPAPVPSCSPAVSFPGASSYG